MSAEFTMGAAATCTDGFCGVVRRTILDPAAETVTHLVVEPRHETGAGRLVPVELVDSTADEIRLRCTLAEFSRLDPAEDIEFTDDSGYSGPTEAASGFGSVGGFGMSGTGPGVAGASHPIHVNHAIPLGETEVERHERVHAVDGEIGQLEGFVVNRADNSVTHVLLKEGHLWGRKEVAIPVDAIDSVADGVRLKITKKQVEDLPPLSAGEL
jgi:sporulation protein YlmC with PRC-barrel domain